MWWYCTPWCIAPNTLIHLQVCIVNLSTRIRNVTYIHLLKLWCHKTWYICQHFSSMLLYALFLNSLCILYGIISSSDFLNFGQFKGICSCSFIFKNSIAFVKIQLNLWKLFCFLERTYHAAAVGRLPYTKSKGLITIVQFQKFMKFFIGREDRTKLWVSIIQKTVVVAIVFGPWIQ